MKYHKHHKLCAVFAALICLATIPVNAQFNYVVNNGAVTITQYTGSGGNVVIPGSISGYPVTSIGAQAFYDYDSLTSVTIANSVTSIGAKAVSDSGFTG